MPPKVEPKSGYRELPLLGDGQAVTVPTEIVETTATAHAIIGGQREALKSFLEQVTDIHRVYRNHVDDAPQPKHIKAALSEIRHLSETLAAALDGLDDRSERFLWAPEGEISNLAFDDTVEASRYGHVFKRYSLSDTHTRVDFVTRAHIESGINILAAYARAAEDRVPVARSGANNKTVYMVVLNCHGFWTRELGRAFTLDTHKGEGITDAFRFCRDVVAMLDADIPPSLIVTQMRKVIADRRQRQSG